ncbi:hypothetical protein BN182_330012 [Clostridioides difficile E9]|nr:hypothetical protein BN182_330012 [Clostridioides difficile E9]CCL70873.1 hypothetical protein BN184_320014 [Clostridioides difficile T3]
MVYWVGNDLDFLLSWYHVLSKLGKKIDAPISHNGISKRLAPYT